MTRYQSGRELEYRVRDLLSEAGYFVVRSAGSRGPVDLIALAMGRTFVHLDAVELRRMLLVQCKRDGVLGPKAWNELFDLACETGGVPVLAEYEPRKPIKFWRLTGRKGGTVGPQPMSPFEVAA